MHCIVDSPPSPRPCEGHLGEQPDPGPSLLQTSSSEVKAAVDFPPASAPPWRVVVSGSSLRAVICQLLTQVSPGSRSPVWWFTIFQGAHRLLQSSFPWVRVRVDRQQANCLLQPTARYQLAKFIMARLEKKLIPWNGLEKALLTAPHIFQHYAIYLVAHSIAGMVPDQLEPSQRDLLRMECTLKSLPPGSMLTVSSDLVDDLMVKLILRLHPLNREGYRPLDQQMLLTTTLKMSCFILATLKKMPGITVDTSLPAPGWNIRRLALLVHCSLIKSFGTSLQGPNMLVSILWEVVEALLARYHSDSPEESSIPTQAPRVMEQEQEMEEKLLSQRLPEQLREQLYGRFGTWVQHGKLFCRALPPISTPEPDLRGGENTSCGPVTGDLLPPAAQPEKAGSNSVPTTDPVVLQRSTVGLIVAQFFRGRDEISSPSHIFRYTAFQDLVVQEVHLLLQREATMFQDNHGFRQTLELLKDPMQEEKLGLQLSRVLQERLKEALPGVCLSRDGLLKDPQNTLLACSLIATEVLDHLKTSVSLPDCHNEAEECLHGEQLLVPLKDPQNPLLASNEQDPQGPLLASNEQDPQGPLLASNEQDPQGSLLASNEQDPQGPLLASNEQDPQGPLLASNEQDPQGSLLASNEQDPQGPLLASNEQDPQGSLLASNEQDPQGPLLASNEQDPQGSLLASNEQDPQGPLLASNEQDPQGSLLASIEQGPLLASNEQDPPDNVKGAEECLHGEGTTSLTSPKETVEVKKKKRRWSWLRRLFTCKSK